MSDDLPIVGRPRGSAWRQLQAEGILWEGQILVAGGDTDLAALLIVTNERLALVRGGVIALEILHDWLYAPPTLRRTGTVGLQVLTPGQRLPESLTFIIREGRLAAAELVEVLTPRERYEPEFPTWDSSMFLDEDPIIPARPAPYERKHSPAPVDPLPPFPVYASLDEDDFPPIAPPPDPMPDWSGAPQIAGTPKVDPNANVIPRQNDWNLKPLDGMDNRDRRNRRAWAMRIAAIVLAAVGIGAWQSGVLPTYSDLRDQFGGSDPVIKTVAELPPATPTEEPTSEPEKTTIPAATRTPEATDDNGGNDAPSSTQSEPTYAPAQQTAVALGVGGGDVDSSDTDVNAAQDEPSATEEPVIAPPEATEPPAAEPTQEPADTEEPVTEEAVPTETAAPTDEATETPGNIIEPTVAPQSVGILDFEISDLQMASSLPDLTLGPLQDERWIVVTLDVKNPGTDVATLDMSQFKLTTVEGDTLDLDAVTGSVAAYLGVTATNGVRDTQEIGPGERTNVVLVFVAPASATGLTLVAGDASMPLAAGASAQSSGGEVALESDLSTQLLTNSFKQYSILTPTATQNAKLAPAGLNPWDVE
jgi:hypothetical protein